MWKLLGWPLALAATVGAYWLHLEGQKRERVLQGQLHIQQQLVAQVSNRLTVVEAQFAIYRTKQEKDIKERELREREERDAERPGLRPTEQVNRAQAEPAEEESEALPDDARARRNNTNHNNNNSGRSIGDGINTLIDRLRNGLGN
jgi:hypothetical protein